MLFLTYDNNLFMFSLQKVIKEIIGKDQAENKTYSVSRNLIFKSFDMSERRFISEKINEKN